MQSRRTIHHFVHRLSITIILVLSTLGLSQPAHAAATINVGPGCSLDQAIQAANTDSAVGSCTAGSGTDTIIVPAGTWPISGIITQPVTINGPFVGVAPGTALSRGAEAIIVPDTNKIGVSIDTAVFDIEASDVTIDGVTIDGDNPSIGGGVSLNGVDSNVATGISNEINTPFGYGTTTIRNNVIRNVIDAGIALYAELAGGTVTGNVITNNHIDNSPGAPNRSGIGVIIYGNFYADVSNNVLTRVRDGLRVEDFYLAGSPTTFSGNSIQAYRRGIWENFQFASASTFTFQNNTILPEPTAAGFFGIYITSMQTATAANFVNNTVTGGQYGVLAWNLSTTGNIVVQGGTLSGNQYGAAIDDCDTRFDLAQAGPNNLILDGVTIQNATSAGIRVYDSSTGFTGPCSGSIPVSITVRNGTRILNSHTGAIVDADAGQPGTATLNMTDSLIYGNSTVGVTRAVAATAGDATVSNNCITRNGAGATNPAGPTINAANNWWGAADGPSGVGPGQGDSVSANVVFAPFLTTQPSACALIPSSPPTVSNGSSSLSGESGLAGIGLCNLMGGGTTPFIRANVPDGTATYNGIYANVFCGVLTDPVQYGVFDRTVLHAIEVTAMTPPPLVSVTKFNNPIEICLQGEGAMLFRDANASPRVVMEVASAFQDGFTCASIPNAGTVILATGTPTVTNPLQGSGKTLDICEITTRGILNLHATPDQAGLVLDLVPYNVTLKATAQQGDWFQVVYGSNQGWVSARLVNADEFCNR